MRTAPARPQLSHDETVLGPWPFTLASIIGGVLFMAVTLLALHNLAFPWALVVFVGGGAACSVVALWGCRDDDRRCIQGPRPDQRAGEHSWAESPGGL
jgi:hypothetical protein